MKILWATISTAATEERRNRNSSENETKTLSATIPCSLTFRQTLRTDTRYEQWWFYTVFAAPQSAHNSIIILVIGNQLGSLFLARLRCQHRRRSIFRFSQKSIEGVSPFELLESLQWFQFEYFYQLIIMIKSHHLIEVRLLTRVWVIFFVNLISFSHRLACIGTQTNDASVLRRQRQHGLNDY